MLTETKKSRRFLSAFVLAEVIAVVFIVSMFVSLAVLNFSHLTSKTGFNSQAEGLASAMRKAVTASAQSDRRYEVIIDITEQYYALRQITSSDITEILEEDIILSRAFNENCMVLYVQFDDFQQTSEGKVFFRAGRIGWQFGGKIVLLDSSGSEHSVVVNRLSRIIYIENGDVELLVPEDDVPF